MNKGTFFKLAMLGLAAFGTACTLTRTPAPPLQGPSELGLSLTTFANPDTLSQDGASQSQIGIEAFDPNGQPAKSIPFRAEILVNGTVTDFGSLSARTLVTGNDGRATLTYTAPPAPLVSIDTNASVTIRLTPSAGDLGNAQGRLVSIRLVPPGVIIGGTGPTALFTVTPSTPQAFVPATFDASTSTAAAGGILVSYSWNFGDGSQASGITAVHQFNATGSYTVSLTVMDNNGVTNTSSQVVSVGAGNVPTAAITISPASGNLTNQTIFFSAAGSTPGIGRRLVGYDWDFGTGSTASGVNVTKSYSAVGTYTVALTVTDDAGQFARVTTTITIAANPTSAPTARFTVNPSPGRVNQPETFDGLPSSTSSGTILRYEWDVDNNGVTDYTTYAPIATVQHTYGAAATYTVRLTVYDSNGLSGTDIRTVVIFP